jgi:UDP-N-acetyl-D-glucosamine dehydrogenase
MKISILGLGYVGFPLACAIAKKTNHELVGYDINQKKIDLINSGISPVDDEQAEQDIKEITINASNDDSILKESDVYIVCVPTPVIGGYTPNLEPVKSSLRTISKYLKKGQVVVIESTINPGVCDEIAIPFLEKETGLKAGTDFNVAHCPERINPGDPNWNVYNIPRNIGSTSKESTKMVANIYREVVDGEINEMPDLKTTEATKIIENTFRDINIAFVNELAKSFDVLGINLDVVIKAAANKPFAFMPHFPSTGVGGHCIPVDPYYLIERAKQSGFDHKFLKLAREINNSMPNYTVEQLSIKLNDHGLPLKGTKVALLGMSYKANVADLRESPSIEVQSLLLSRGVDLTIYDPYFSEISNVKNLEEALDNCVAVVICTNHKEFVELTVEDLVNKNVKIVIDGKNCLSDEFLSTNKLSYKGIGR